MFACAYVQARVSPRDGCCLCCNVDADDDDDDDCDLYENYYNADDYYNLI